MTPTVGAQARTILVCMAVQLFGRMRNTKVVDHTTCAIKGDDFVRPLDKQ